MACYTPISFDQFVRGLALQPTQPVSLVTRTIPEMIMRGNPFAARGILKYEGRSGFIGADYKSVVMRQRRRENRPTDESGQVIRFRPSSLWNGRGEHVRGNRHLVRHVDTGELYLVFYQAHDAKGRTKHLWQRFEFTDTCDTADASDVRPWLIESNVSERQLTRKKIPWRVIALKSIVRIRMNGVLYALDASASAMAIDERVLALALGELPRRTRGQWIDTLRHFVGESGELPPPDEDLLELARDLLDKLRPKQHAVPA